MAEPGPGLPPADPTLDAGPEPEGGEGGLMQPRRPFRTFIGRVYRHRPAFIGACIVTLFFLMAIPGMVMAITGAEAEYFDHLAPPSLEHPLGTDETGKDMTTLMTWGAWTSLRVGLMAVGLSILIGVPLGVLAGYAGGWTDMILGRVIDMIMAFPSILLALTIVSVLGQSLDHIILAVGIVGAPMFARQVRATVLVVSRLEFVEAARAIGFRHVHIMLREILPNCITPILVLATLGIGTAILDVAGLSFLGLSGDLDLPEWGRMLQENKGRLNDQPLLVLAPGIGVFLAVLGFNLLGDGLRDLFDPRFGRDRG